MQEEQAILEQETSLYIQVGIVIQIGGLVLYYHHQVIASIGIGREIQIDITSCMKCVTERLGCLTTCHRIGFRYRIGRIPSEVKVVIVVSQGLL